MLQPPPIQPDMSPPWGIIRAANLALPFPVMTPSHLAFSCLFIFYPAECWDTYICGRAAAKCYDSEMTDQCDGTLHYLQGEY